METNTNTNTIDGLFETSEKKERFVLFAADVKKAADSADAESSLAELEQLVDTVGGETAGKLIQNTEAIHSAYYFGKGKLEELKNLAEATDAVGVICDDELSPAQYKNMERILDIKIIDRTALILEIFAQNAHSGEALAQVELAQLTYRLSRLAGLGKSLSRLGGGIGTRGPGEKKLETDRRHIRNRITKLNDELKEIETRRDVLRNKREKTGIPVVSLVGYTNAGKSTVMNMISGADVKAENKLFATLDTTTRNVKSSAAGEFLMTDTIGFIQKLPHTLIKAFRATLEELKYADILIHVVDSSNKNHEAQMRVVYKTLAGLGISGKPIITAYNKTDIETENTLFRDTVAECTVKISALTGAGKEDLLQAIETQIKNLKTEIRALIPYSCGALLNLIHKNGEMIEETYEESGTCVNAHVPPEIAKKLEQMGFLIGY